MTKCPQYIVYSSVPSTDDSRPNVFRGIHYTFFYKSEILLDLLHRRKKHSSRGLFEMSLERDLYLRAEPLEPLEPESTVHCLPVHGIVYGPRGDPFLFHKKVEMVSDLLVRALLSRLSSLFCHLFATIYYYIFSLVSLNLRRM
jgi:hypothetical protein